MIAVSLGANLGRSGQSVRETLEAAAAALTRDRISVLARSRWYRSAPVPISDQPDYVNGTVLIETDLDPWQLLTILHRIESNFGRRRERRWGARTLDLDLVDHRGFVTFNGWRDGRLHTPGAGLCLPHPRAHERAFVLRPLAEVAPGWRHPVLGLSAAALLGGPVADQPCEPLDSQAAN